MTSLQTRNCTSTCVDDFTSMGFPILYIWAPLCVVVVCQNVLCLVIMGRNSKLHTNTNMIFASVMSSDILSSLCFLMDGITNHPDIDIRLGDPITVETVIMGISFSFLLLTTTHMGILSVDRYIYIAQPFYYMKHVTKRLVVTIIACLWCVALVFGLIPLFIYNDISHHKKCILIHPPAEYFWTFVFMGISNSLILVLFYFKIALLAFRRRKAMNSRHAATNHPGNINMFKKNTTPALKSVKFVAITCGVYVTCLAPCGMSEIISAVYPLPGVLRLSLINLIIVHSLLNFGIYVHMNADFRQALKNMFSKVKRSCFLGKRFQ